MFECPICLDEVEDCDVCSLQCKHKFCQSCVDNWLSCGKNECPMCRCKINPNKAKTSKQNDLKIDYIYLDSDERRHFAQEGHEYLIDQLHEQNHKNFKLNFNHSVKELFWTKSIKSL